MFSFLNLYIYCYFPSGVHVVKDAQGSYHIKIMISRNVNHRQVSIKVDLTATESGELNVNLKCEDTLYTKSDVNTTPLHGDDRNEVSVLRHIIK